MTLTIIFFSSIELNYNLYTVIIIQYTIKLLKRNAASKGKGPSKKAKDEFLVALDSRLVIFARTWKILLLNLFDGLSTICNIHECMRGLFGVMLLTCIIWFDSAFVMNTAKIRLENIVHVTQDQ